MKQSLTTKPVRTIASAVVVCTAITLLSTHATFASPSDFFDPSHVLAGSGVSTSSATDLALNILAAFLSLIGLIDVCVIIYGGFTIMLSNGNPEKVKSGRDTLIWAIVGSLIIFSALGIVIYLGNIISPA